MIAHQDDLRFVLQGGPHRVLGDRAKFYAGYFCLQFAVDGDIAIGFDQQTYEFDKPVVWISRPGPFISHRVPTGGKGWIHRYVAFAGPLADRWYQDGLIPREPVVVQDPMRLSEKMDAALAIDILPEGAWAFARKRNIIESILLDLVQPFDEHEQDWLSEAKSLLLGDWDLSAIAKQLGMGLSTLRRKFNQEAGCSPQRWRMEERMRQSQELLRDDSLSIGSIAEQLRYPSIFQFSKQFKKMVGLTPSEWRQATQD